MPTELLLHELNQEGARKTTQVVGDRKELKNKIANQKQKIQVLQRYLL